ncbi:Stp1/IreP family PP2C-type Ser/Thr phosphatase [Sinanaerobacter sp. ZZT-01]|uniref:Stp1/IreP family PP2C-type Ser/Thr phosphatase n=1 Tax=Sinanaerobacter sp. ZZT-01 TaxID=3111540 RepID=UPI002D766313|nr:Stp1/IreP family PP2C-type Ser/Thr phosphatase [Sinanaerobacter sp. ZZT-01]WRR92782.1 Stp1/IreP family PP2C-type Ser/Thr phosphatase [Sinanaerobacter sp. ZZT-01]
MLRVGFKTDRGRQRSNNEDAFFIMPAQRVYIVADGVGGHNSGEIASRFVVQQIAEYVAKNHIPATNGEEELKQYLLKCLRQVNRQLYEMAKESQKNVGMATTLALVYMNDMKAYIVNVGDSRVYLIRDKLIRQITEDHTYVNQLLKSGAITKEEADCHPKRNMITRAIGAEYDLSPDFYQFKVYEGDLILMCTDGLYGELSEEKINAMAQGKRSMHRLANDYVKEANERGGKDNITVVCIMI